MPQHLNVYYNRNAVAKGIKAGAHRSLIGGLWDELGSLQLQYLCAQGLKPHHRVLDIGCGCLRAGTRFADYLDPGLYYGIDLSQELIDVGYDKELTPQIRAKLPRENLAVSSQFEIPFDVDFDFVIAQSVFTHLPLNHLTLCLSNIQTVLADGAAVYVSYFQAPDLKTWTGAMSHQPGNITSHPDRDPYHYQPGQLQSCAAGLPYEFENIGDWHRPRGQSLARFTKRATSDNHPSATRMQTRDQALSLKPGSDHYRAFVGPPGNFDFMSATQFSLLFALGLRETSQVLDIGCGSLRLGRLLIPFLQTDRYCGVEPNSWLVQDGIDRELGRDALTLKTPQFSGRSDYNFAEFNRCFDFIMAQSMVTHAGPDQLQLLFKGAADHLSGNGIFTFSYTPGGPDKPLPADGWHYPQCVGYRPEHLHQRLASFDLCAVEIPWFHPGARWMVVAKDPSRLPQDADLQMLNGRVFSGPE